MSWTQVVKDWNKTKVIKDDSGVYALPIRGGDDYKDVRRMYDKIKKKQAEKEIEADKKLQKKIEVKKPVVEVTKPVVEVKKADKMKKPDRMKKASEHISSLLSQIKKPDDIALKDAEAIIDRFKKYLLINSTVLARKGDYGVFWKEYDEYRGVTDNDLAHVAREQIVRYYNNEPAYQFINKLEDYVIALSYADDKGAYILEKDISKLDKVRNVALIEKAIAERRVERKAERELTKRREKAAEGLKKVASETAERNKQRKREAEERKMMAGEEVLSREKRSEKLEKKEAKGTITKMEAATLFEDKYVEGYEFKDRKDMAIAVRAFRIALPDLTSSVDTLAKFFMKRGFKGSEYEMAFRKGAARPGKTFVQDALNNRV